jgi:hypothetical protein
MICVAVALGIHEHQAPVTAGCPVKTIGRGHHDRLPREFSLAKPGSLRSQKLSDKLRRDQKQREKHSDQHE